MTHSEPRLGAGGARASGENRDAKSMMHDILRSQSVNSEQAWCSFGFQCTGEEHKFEYRGVRVIKGGVQGIIKKSNG